MRFAPYRLLAVLARAPFVILVYAHLAVLLSQLPSAPGAASLLLPSGRRGLLFAQSLLTAAVVALLCLLIALPAAWHLWSSRGPVASTLLPLTFALVLLPSYVYCYGWSPLFTALRGVWSPGSLPSLVASIWVQTMSLLPLAVLLGVLAWQSLDPTLLDAARVARSPVVVWREVILPHSRPVLGSAAGLLFVVALLDYSIPSLFSIPTYSMEIFTQFGVNPSAPHALALALPLMLVSTTVLLVSQGPFRRVALGHSARTSSVSSLQPEGIGRMVQAVAVLVLIIQVAVAIGALFATPHPLDSIAGAWNSGQEQIIFTFALALVTALVSIPAALPVALAMSSRAWCGRVWWAIAVCPFAIPASLTGIGFIALWNRPGLEYVYDSPAILILAWLARFLPLVALVLAAFISRVDSLLLDAVDVFGDSWGSRWLGAYIRLFGPGMLAAAALTFAMSVGEIGASLIVAPPGSATMSMRIYGYLHAGARDTAAGLCAIQMLIALVAAAPVLRLGRAQ